MPLVAHSSLPTFHRLIAEGGSVTTLERAYPTIGSFTRMTVLGRDGKGLWGGRVLKVRLEGTRGHVDITGERLRSVVGSTTLRSTYFKPASSL